MKYQKDKETYNEIGSHECLSWTIMIYNSQHFSNSQIYKKQQYQYYNNYNNNNSKRIRIKIHYLFD